MHRRHVALTQGIYFLATGMWPLVHMSSFEAVTGPKVEKWLVRTTGVLISVIGAVLVGAAARNEVTRDIAALGVGSAAGLGAIDTIYAVKRRIAPVYLADAAVEAGLIAGWGAARGSRE
jgi:hypothetical protein